MITACADGSDRIVSATTSPVATVTVPDPASTTTTMRAQRVEDPGSIPVHNGGGRLAAPIEPGTPLVQLAHASLTTRNWATYDYTTGPETVTASMPAGVTDPNIREVFWRADADPVVDGQTCVTWQETSESVEGEPIQPGLAMRVASVGADNGGLRAVTLTENVLYAGTWLFNVHVWDTRSLVPMTLVKTFDVSRVVGRIAKVDGRADNSMVQPPWHLCARTSGDTFTFKVWTQNNREPSWSNPRQVFSVQLPAGWTYPGYSGGYIGHLHPGQHATATLDPVARAG